MLGLPLIAALASGTPSLPAALVAVAACCAFLAHEPALVLLGRRGERLQRTLGGRASRLLLGLVALGGAAVVPGVIGLPPAERGWFLLPVVLGAGLAGLALAGRERTGEGEVLAGLALGAWAVPVALGGGVSLDRALALWGVLGLGFGLLTIAVRTVIASYKPRASGRARTLAIGLCAGLGLTGMGVSASTPLEGGFALALGLFAAVGTTMVIVRPSPRHLKLQGWCVAASSVLATVPVILAARG